MTEISVLTKFLCMHLEPVDTLIIRLLTSYEYNYTCFDRGTKMIKSSNPCPAMNTVKI